MNRKVYLEGELGNKFGKEFTMNAKSFSDVFRCLECNYPEIRQYLIECEENNIGFVCEVAGTPLNSEAELLLQYNEGDMVVTPLPAGSKSGGAKILAAIAITMLTAGAAAALMPNTMAAVGAAATGVPTYSTGFMSAFSSGANFGAALGAASQSLAGLTALGVAVNLAMTGVNQIMAPDPSVDNDQDESYLFQGTGQTLIEGDPVPVLYGQLRVPGRPISTQVRGEKLTFMDYGINPITSDDPSTGGTPAITGITTPASIAEGSSANITVTTSNIAQGTTLYWTIIPKSDGLDIENDFVENTDSFTVSSNNNGSFSIRPASDTLSETTESFALEVFGGGTGTPKESATINIIDSTTGGSTPDPDKEISSISSNVTNVDEGSLVTFTITTSGLSDGTRLNYYVSQAATYGEVSSDFSAYRGEVAIGNNIGYVFITPDADLTTEGSEQFKLIVEGEDVESKVSSLITVNDTSLTPSETPDTPESNPDGEQDDDRADQEEQAPSPGGGRLPSPTPDPPSPH